MSGRSHAAHVGLRPGDFILRVRGKPARSPAHLLAALGTKPDWTRVRLDWTRVRLEVLRRGELLNLQAR